MTAVLLSPLFQQYSDANGNPLSGGKIYSYLAGTLTPQATYTDATGLIATDNPIELDSAGRPPVGGVWGSGTYYFELKDSAGVTVGTIDNVTAIYGAGDMTKAVYDAANIAQQLVGLTAVQTVTSKTFTGSTINGSSNTLSNLYGGKTSAATTSGTSVDISTTVPSTASRIDLIFAGVSTNGTSNPVIQIGSGSYTTSGYGGATTIIANGVSPVTAAYGASGFQVPSALAANAIIGIMTLHKFAGTNTWDAIGQFYIGSTTLQTTGQVTLGGTLDRVRITTVGGADTFDAGSIAISYIG